RAHQHRTDHLEREVGKDREAKGDRHVITDAEFAADLDLAQRPRAEGAECAAGDQLPEAAFREWREGEPIFRIRRVDADLPDIPGRPERRGVQDHRDADESEEDRRDAEETDIKWPDPEIEEISADQRSTADAVFAFKAEHSHRSFLRC